MRALTTLYLSLNERPRLFTRGTRGGLAPVRGRPDLAAPSGDVPCYMVAMRDELSPSTLALPTTPLLAVAPITSKDLFPIPQWRARDGRGLKFDKWWRSVQSLLNALDITVERLSEQPPTSP